VLSYDAMNILIEAVENGARSGADVQKHLDALGHGTATFKGVAGPVSFDSLGDVTRGYVLRQIPVHPL
jgi:ABC-type branched-subunit amino acid transport system substrate-binding protein